VKVYRTLRSVEINSIIVHLKVIVISLIFLTQTNVKQDTIGSGACCREFTRVRNGLNWAQVEGEKSHYIRVVRNSRFEISDR